MINRGSIKEDARKKSKLSTDFDNFRNRYYEIDSSQNIAVYLPAFEIKAFQKNYYILLRNSKKYKFNIGRWTMRPDYASYDLYQTEIWWPLLLYLNNCYQIEDFEGFTEIYAPQNNYLLELLKNRGVEKQLFEINPTPNLNYKNNYYYKNFVGGNNYTDKMNAKNILNNQNNTGKSVQTTTNEINATYTITNNDLINKYIELQYTPDAGTLSVFYNNYTIALKYNFDYALMLDKLKQPKILSWNYTDVNNSRGNSLQPITNNTGIRKYIKVNDVIRVKYTTTIYNNVPINIQTNS